MPQGRDESANLDLLRATAVLCVFLAHLENTITGVRGEISWHFGQLGVLMFFVHTSLVLMMSMERMRLGRMALVISFYSRRFFRLYPLSVLWVLLMYVCQGPWTITDLWTNLLLVQNLFYRPSIGGVLWTLALEVQMYLLLPVLFLFFQKRSMAWVLGFWVASIPIATIQLQVSGRFDVISYVPCFLGGVIAWRMMREFATRRLPGLLWPAAMAVSTLVWMIATREHNMVYRSLFGLTLGLTIPWFREIEWKPLNVLSHTIAKYSYGVYLTHGPVMWLAFIVLDGYHPALRWGLFVVLVAGLPVVMYYCIEAPCIKLGRRIASRRERTYVVHSKAQAA